MKNFEYKNPVKIIFGKGTIPKVADEIPENAKVLMIYGGGSIKQKWSLRPGKKCTERFRAV
jgi:NADP-dependent alcohol dehydrogenase